MTNLSGITLDKLGHPATAVYWHPQITLSYTVGDGGSGSGGSGSFKVYSAYGTGAASSDTEIGGNEIADGDIIEMPNHGGIHLYYSDFSGFSTDDPRRLVFETDFGERYDAQFLDHPHLPSDQATAASATPTLGIYPGFVCGHAFRGTDMAGNQVLDKDHQEGALPAGVTDRTVTCWVSDGLTNAEISFTVRLIDPLRYYTDTTKSTYGTSAHTFGQTENRKGVYYISTDGDFTGAPTGEAAGEIYHLTISDGRFYPNFIANLDRPNITCIDSFDGSAKTSNGFGLNDDWTVATFWKAGNTFYPMQGDPSDNAVLGKVNSLMASWGTANNGRAIFKAAQDWDRGNKWLPDYASPILSIDGNGPGEGRRIYNIEVAPSDYDVSDPEWRDWWNILNYSNKSGTFQNKTNGSVEDYSGDLLTNAGNTAYASVIRDDDNGDGTGQLIVRQVVAGSDGKSGDPAAFSDGDTLTGGTSGATATFVAAGSRQDRTKKGLPDALAGQGNGGPPGACIDACIVRGANVGINEISPHNVISDTAVLDCCNYGMFGSGKATTLNAVVIAQPSSYDGGVRAISGAVNPDRSKFNVFTDETTPAPNEVSHAGCRMSSPSSVSFYKCAGYWYGGADGIHQPFLRLGTSGVQAFQLYMHMSGCFWRGGNQTIGLVGNDGDRGPFTPKGIVIDGNVMDANHATGESHLIGIRYTTSAIVNNTLAYQSGQDIGFQNAAVQFIRWAQTGDNTFDTTPDVEPYLEPFVEGNTFVYEANQTQGSVADFMRNIRGITVTYSGNTSTIDAAKISGSISADHT